MPLNGDTLGTNLYNAEVAYNNKNPDDLGDIETARRNFWKAMGNEIVNYIKANAMLTIPSTGFVTTTPGSPVAGVSTIGTIS